MKTTILFLSVALTAATATAQQRISSLVFNDDVRRVSAAHESLPISTQPNFTRGRNRTAGSNERTTGVTSRWYNYGDYLSTTGPSSLAGMYLWNDTTSVDAYAGATHGTEYDFNKMVSVGLVVDPFYYAWNDALVYPGSMQLTAADNYTIDSVFISGVYARNDARPAPVDTLTLAIMYGNGNANSDLHYKAIDSTGGRQWIHDEYNVDTLYYMNMHHDTVNNHADTFQGGVTPIIKKIYLTSADTSSAYSTVLPVSINVPAGNMPAMSLSFKSGDATFTPGDTVFFGTGSAVLYKYGMFRPLIAYSGNSTAAAFPPNNKEDLSEGQYRDAGSDRLANGLYRPHWFWYNAATGGASTQQYPYFAFHISCPTCSTVGVSGVAPQVAGARAYPNPANDQLTISFTLRHVAAATVTLTNMLGQQVAAQSTAQVANGQVVFNTSSLPAGIYLYTVDADGGRIVGRVVVAH